MRQLYTVVTPRLVPEIYSGKIYYSAAGFDRGSQPNFSYRVDGKTHCLPDNAITNEYVPKSLISQLIC